MAYEALEMRPVADERLRDLIQMHIFYLIKYYLKQCTVAIQNPLMMTHKANHQTKTQFIDNWKVTSIPWRNMLAPPLVKCCVEGIYSQNTHKM